MKVISSFCIFLNVGILFIGCEKNEVNPSSNNPTNGKTTAVFNNSKTYGNMTDQDGNVYKTINIGNQTWMVENLRTTKYRDGSVIQEITENETWRILSTGAYCNYNNTKSSDTIATYGRIYNWYSVSDTRNVAPLGWHVPTNEEWVQLIDYFGGSATAGAKLKETGTTHWKSPNTGATNESGFTAIPSGNRFTDIGFGNFGYNVTWWSATEDEWDSNRAMYQSVYYDFIYCFGYSMPKNAGNYVRCVKD